VKELISSSSKEVGLYAEVVDELSDFVTFLDLISELLSFIPLINFALCNDSGVVRTLRELGVGYRGYARNSG